MIILFANFLCFRGRGGHYDEDDEGHGHHGPGVQCASQ